MDIKEIIFDLIDDHTKGVDTYNHNGSTWLIFTDSKKWVIELTKEKTLWYNYYFFNNIFKYLSLDVVENQHYITKWVEDIVMNVVKETRITIDPQFHSIEDTIQNGIKETYMAKDNNIYDPHTFTTSKQVRNERINDVIENGIIETKSEVATREWKAGEVIDNGIKEVKELPDQSGELRGYGDYYRRQDDMTKPHTLYVNDVINGGIKETVTGSDKRMLVENVLNNGIKLT